MLSDFVQWVVVSSYAEILGSLIIIAFAIGVLYILYEVIKFFIDMYIQSKLVELYKQKDRLWDAYTSLYDDIDDLKEKTWDYDITKKKLKVAMKDIEDLEEYVLNQDNYDLAIKKLWEQRDTIYYFIDKLEGKADILEKDKLLK